MKAKGRVAIDPFDGLTLEAKLGGGKLQCRPGEAIVVEPRLETADHMRSEPVIAATSRTRPRDIPARRSAS